VGHWILIAWYTISGANNEGGPVYGSWSGIAGATSAIAAPFVALIFYWHHTCHDSPRCFRWAKYEAAGGMFKYCHRHHPDFNGKRPDREARHRMHREWKAGQQQ
jgi:hypothetical protein